jgi:hypothetical protein
MTKTSAIAAIIDYVENPQKTDNGRLITSYGCSSLTADKEFLISKREYEYITGRSQGRHDVIAYHIRQAFKPGEITPEEADEIGQQLAMSFTKGNHAFVVCTHVDRRHIHNHIIFNSTPLDCERKFKNFFFSSRAIRRISDLLCVEHGLSIIENPKVGGSVSYNKWLGDKPPSWKELLVRKTDEVLPSCSSFNEFINAMKTAGYTVDEKRKYISLKAVGQKKPTRLKTLGENYTEAAIIERIAGNGIVNINGFSDNQNTENTLNYNHDNNVNHAGNVNDVNDSKTHVNLLIDIQEKIRRGKNAGYEHWAKSFNLKQSAKTLIFLQEKGIDSYDDLVVKSAAASENFNALTKKIKDIEPRLKEIAELQKYIGQYRKTRDVYAQYKESKYSRKFYDEHTSEIILHKAAKKYFDGLGLKKLPTIPELKQEYAILSTEKKKLYASYHSAKNQTREPALAKADADKLLGVNQGLQDRKVDVFRT